MHRLFILYGPRHELERHVHRLHNANYTKRPLFNCNKVLYVQAKLEEALIYFASYLKLEYYDIAGKIESTNCTKPIITKQLKELIFQPQEIRGGKTYV